jgi:hypothetical protein
MTVLIRWGVSAMAMMVPNMMRAIMSPKTSLRGKGEAGFDDHS